MIWKADVRYWKIPQVRLSETHVWEISPSAFIDQTVINMSCNQTPLLFNNLHYLIQLIFIKHSTYTRYYMQLFAYVFCQIIQTRRWSLDWMRWGAFGFFYTRGKITLQNRKVHLLVKLTDKLYPSHRISSMHTISAKFTRTTSILHLDFYVL